jgi:hypothetical protein
MGGSTSIRQQALSEPLLAVEAPQQHELGGQRAARLPDKQHELGLAGSVMNLTKAILGAGLLSVPRAVSLLGGGLSLVALVLVVRQ